MRFNVNIEETNKLYHYNTKEIVMVCPKCKKEYKTRKICLDCFKKRNEKVKTEPDVKEYTGWITKDLKKYSCSCPFAAYYGHARYWWELRPQSICKHAKAALIEIRKSLNNRCDCPNQNDKKHKMPSLR